MIVIGVIVKYTNCLKFHTNAEKTESAVITPIIKMFV